MKQSRRARRGISLLFSAIVAFVMLALLLFSMLQYWLNSNNAANAIADALGSRLGVQVEFSSSLEVHLFPRPNLALRGLALRSPVDDELIAYGNTATLEIALSALLKRAIEINSLVVDGVELYGLNHWLESTPDQGLAARESGQQEITVSYPARIELRSIKLLNSEAQPQLVLDELIWSEVSEPALTSSTRQFQMTLGICQVRSTPFCLYAEAQVESNAQSVMTLNVDVTDMTLTYDQSVFATGILEFEVNPIEFQVTQGTLTDGHRWAIDIHELNAQFGSEGRFQTELGLNYTDQSLPISLNGVLLAQGGFSDARFTLNMSTNSKIKSNVIGTACWDTNPALIVSVDQLDLTPWIRESQSRVEPAIGSAPTALSGFLQSIEAGMLEIGLGGRFGIEQLSWPGGTALGVEVPFPGLINCSIPEPGISDPN